MFSQDPAKTMARFAPGLEQFFTESVHLNADGEQASILTSVLELNPTKIQNAIGLLVALFAPSSHPYR